MTRILRVADLGLVPYGEALALQRRLAEERISGAQSDDMLLLLEHPPVITLGRGFKASSLPLPVDALERRGIEVHDIERGGDVTYHGPGQLVGYPIFHLERHKPDLHWYLRQLEQALIDALAVLGVPATRNPGLTGVWTAAGPRKIASIGIHVRQWVTWHGFALNVTADLSPFSLIVPCGIPDVVMTSVARETSGGQADSNDSQAAASVMQRTRTAVIDAFVRTFEFNAATDLDVPRLSLTA